jgi:hypothetical protein
MEDEEVAGAPQGLDLPGEEAMEPQIVAHRRQDRRVCCQRDCGQARPLPPESHHVLGGQMLGVGRRAPIAAKEDLATPSKGLEDVFGQSGDLVAVGPRHVRSQFRELQ